MADRNLIKGISNSEAWLKRRYGRTASSETLMRAWAARQSMKPLIKGIDNKPGAFSRQGSSEGSEPPPAEHEGVRGAHGEIRRETLTCPDCSHESPVQERGTVKASPAA